MPCSKAIERQKNQNLLELQRNVRTAADYVVAGLAGRPEVRKVAFFGSVAVTFWKEVPRFREFRRAGAGLGGNMEAVRVGHGLER